MANVCWLLTLNQCVKRACRWAGGDVGHDAVRVIAYTGVIAWPILGIL
jgi:hypothetical protein